MYLLATSTTEYLEAVYLGFSHVILVKYFYYTVVCAVARCLSIHTIFTCQYCIETAAHIIKVFCAKNP